MDILDLNETILSEKIIYEKDFFKLVNEEILLPNGEITKRDVIRHNGAVGIIAFKDDETIILVEQYRSAVKSITLEIPAGKIIRNEEIKECAKRELKEETGYFTEDIEFIGQLYVAPGFTDQIIYLFVAKNLKKGETNFDFDEFINLKEFKLEKVYELIQSGNIKDAKTIAALQLLKK